jgi:hypothetical protein
MNIKTHSNASNRAPPHHRALKNNPRIWISVLTSRQPPLSFRPFATSDLWESKQLKIKPMNIYASPLRSLFSEALSGNGQNEKEVKKKTSKSYKHRAVEKKEFIIYTLRELMSNFIQFCYFEENLFTLLSVSFDDVGVLNVCRALNNEKTRENLLLVILMMVLRAGKCPSKKK